MLAGALYVHVVAVNILLLLFLLIIIITRRLPNILVEKDCGRGEVGGGRCKGGEDVVAAELVGSFPLCRQDDAAVMLCVLGTGTQDGIDVGWSTRKRTRLRLGTRQFGRGPERDSCSLLASPSEAW